jgi:hypothetical protein
MAMAKRDGLPIAWFNTGPAISGVPDVVCNYLTVAVPRSHGASLLPDHGEVDFIIAGARLPCAPGFRAHLMRATSQTDLHAQRWKSNATFYTSAKAANTLGPTELIQAFVPRCPDFRHGWRSPTPNIRARLNGKREADHG